MTMLRAFITSVAALTLASCGNGSGGTSAQDDGPATLDEIAIGDVIMGDPDAPLTLVEYASITCGACGQFHATVMPVIKERVEAGDINFIFREFPTAPAEIATAGFAVARCAGADDYYDVLDEFYDNQQDFFNAIRSGSAGDMLRDIASEYGINNAGFRECTRDRELFSSMMETVRGGEEMGVTHTPTLFLNGAQLGNEARTPDGMNAVIDAALAALD